MDGICGGGLIFPREDQPAEVQGIRSEAAEGIRTLDLLHGNYADLLARTALEPADLQDIFVWCDRRSPLSIRVDVRRYAAFRALLTRSARNQQGRFQLART
jgi:hypothetical protein